MKNEPRIWSVFFPLGGGCFEYFRHPPDPGNELLGLGKQNNYRQVQKLSILSVCNYPECFRGLLRRIVRPMRGQYSEYWPIRSPGADTMKWLNWHHLWETYFVFETPILLCDARSTVWQEVDAGSGPQTLTVNLVFCCYTFYITNDLMIFWTY